MNKLEQKLKSITDMVNVLELDKSEVVKLLKNLISSYKVSFGDLFPDVKKKFEEVKDSASKLSASASAIDVREEQHSEIADIKGKTVALEVVYEGGVRSKQVIAGRAPIGIVFEHNKMLYWQESGDEFTRDQAAVFLKRLPTGYDWHLMKEREAIAIRNILGKVNETLRLIGGDVIGSRNYMLGDDTQNNGIVRYVARIN